MPGPVAFETVNAPPAFVVVTGPDGAKYEIQFALLFASVTDSGMTNPLDGMPIFNFAIQLVSQTKRIKEPDA